MGIVHHSNYIRFMEEARMCYLEDVGFSMSHIESLGIVSPVVSVKCEYKRSCKFNDEIEIDVTIKQYTGVKLILSYIMRNIRDNEVVATGTSAHCFTELSGNPVAVKKNMPELDKILLRLSECK